MQCQLQKSVQGDWYASPREGGIDNLCSDFSKYWVWCPNTVLDPPPMYGLLSGYVGGDHWVDGSPRAVNAEGRMNWTQSPAIHQTWSGAPCLT